MNNGRPELEARLDQLTDEQRRELASRLGVGTTRPNRLEVFVTGTSSAEEVCDWLAQRLPKYMVPSTVHVLDGLPRTQTGKIDRRTLLALTPGNEQDRAGAAAPEEEAERFTEIEEQLAEIWREVLSLDLVQPGDDFFELGGDSILSIRMVSRARRVGLRIDPVDLADFPTVRELAAAAGSRSTADADSDDRSPVLLPIQSWFLETYASEENRPGDPGHWNQAIEIPLRRQVSRAELTAAMRVLLAAHPALRTVYRRSRSKPQLMGGSEAVSEEASWEVDLLADAEPVIELVDGTPSAEKHLRRGFRLHEGPLVRCGLDTTRPRLVLVAHHLVVDNTSWSILVDDLDRALSGRPVESDDYVRWTHAYAARVRSVRDQVPFWQRQVDPGSISPARVPSKRIRVQLDVTPATVQEAARALDCTTEELLLAVTMTCAANLGDQDDVVVGIEHHGRDPLTDGGDGYGCVGWLTAFFPIRTGRLPEAPGDVVRLARAVRRGVPGNGRGFGLLKYLVRDDTLRAAGSPAVLFNLLGTVSEAAPGDVLGAAVGLLEDCRDVSLASPHSMEFDWDFGDSPCVWLSWNPKAINLADGPNPAHAIQSTMAGFLMARLAEDDPASDVEFGQSGLDASQLDDFLSSID